MSPALKKLLTLGRKPSSQREASAMLDVARDSILTLAAEKSGLPTASAENKINSLIDRVNSATVAGNKLRAAIAHSKAVRTAAKRPTAAASPRPAPTAAKPAATAPRAAIAPKTPDLGAAMKGERDSVLRALAAAGSVATAEERQAAVAELRNRGWTQRGASGWSRSADCAGARAKSKAERLARAAR